MFYFFFNLISQTIVTKAISVIDTIMSLLTDKAEWEPELISVFQFTTLFREKHATAFVENLAHEGSKF